jgi:hypothetical protein
MKTIKKIKNRVSFPGLYNNPCKIFRIFLYLIVFTGACMTFSSCAGGYIAAEPSYNDVYDRPVSPGIGYIWIDGDWRWNRQTHNYVHDHGYWARPKQGRSYETGHWESEPRGKYWIKGRWNRENKTPSREHDHDRR